MSYHLVDVFDSVAYVSGTYALTSSRSVSVIDAMNPASPVWIGSHVTNSGWYEISDGSAIDSYRWVNLISTVPVTQPIPVATYFGAGSPDFRVREGKYIYLSSTGSGLDILYDCSVFTDGFDFGRTTAWSDVVE